MELQRVRRRTLLTAALTGALAALQLFAQTPTSYLQVSSMKVPPNKEAEYVKVEREIWKPIHQARVNRGNVQGWSLWAIEFPEGSQREEDFFTTESFDSWHKIRNSYDGIEISKVHPNLNIDNLGERTMASRDMRRVDYLAVVDGAGRFPTKPGAEVIQVRRYRTEPGMGAQYEKFIHESAKPLVEAQIEKGALMGWVAYRVAIPGPGEIKYDYLHAYAYKDFDALENPMKGIDLQRYVKGSLEDLGARLRSMRKEGDSMVLSLVDATDPKQ